MHRGYGEPGGEKECAKDPTRADKNTWTITVFLKGGQEAKFRASDSWDVNWGAAAYPSGTGTQGHTRTRMISKGEKGNKTQEHR
ncbi:MAG: hypothetical protein U5K79_02810 [Cyclobacteriaceae bacterium]|nr:hypothetical protein [Cyclobacteriaceae bacterium]